MKGSGGGVIHQGGKKRWNQQRWRADLLSGELALLQDGGGDGEQNRVSIKLQYNLKTTPWHNKTHLWPEKEKKSHSTILPLHHPQLLLSLSLGGIRLSTPPLLLYYSWYHVALHLFIYLLGSLSPLSQPIEAIAGVQPVVGVIVLTHSLPQKQPLFHSTLFLHFCFFSSLYPLVWSLSPSSVKRSEPTSLLSGPHSVVEHPSQADGRGEEGGLGGSGRGGGGETREERGGSTMVLLWQQLPPVFIWKPRWRTKIVATRAWTHTYTHARCTHIFELFLLKNQTSTVKGNNTNHNWQLNMTLTEW